MHLSQGLQIALIAAAGGLAGQFLVVATDLDAGKWPELLTGRAFWLSTLCWVGLSALVAWLEGGLPHIAAFQVGVSIKPLLNRMGRAIPTQVGSNEAH
jgi:hypothetical protein